ERASELFSEVVVATDDERIRLEVIRFGGKVVMTSPNHKSGTDRCAEALQRVEEATSGKAFDVVVNIQGDEPFICPSQLELLKSSFLRSEVDIATLVQPLTDPDDISNPNCVKAVVAKNGNAIYFSRSPIPYVRGVEPAFWPDQHPFYRHIGLYAYRVPVLREITRLEPSSLELAESLEQNRWLENGYVIATSVTTELSVGIDTPADLQRVISDFGHLL
ncbi:MAG: 3-deoxy-manno-octulosonate cytidylyltransferase, partial [Bacteroidales bacterium]